MWVLPSRLRPQNIKRFIEGWKETGSCTKLCLALDKDDPQLDEYLKIKLPSTWRLVIVPKRLSLMAIYNYVYKKFSWEPWYGILDDDYMPQSQYWDAQLVAECKRNNAIVYPKNNLIGPENLACWVIPAGLVRKMGWLMPPFTKRLYGDNVWLEIGTKFKCLKYCDDIEIRHYHFSDGSAPYDETYNKPSAADDALAFQKWKFNFNPEPPVTFVCVDAGNYQGHGEKYVKILLDSVVRNLAQTVRGKFICLTDREGVYYGECVKIKYIDEMTSHFHKGWWNKMLLFKPGLFKKGERIIYFDLDTVIVSGLDKIIKYKGDFAMLRDFYRPEGLGSGVMMWTPSKQTEDIWNEYKRAGYPEDIEGGDQAWIEQCVGTGILKKPELLQDIFPGQFVSYKVHAKWDVPKNAKVVCFHGWPKQSDFDEHGYARREV